MVTRVTGTTLTVADVGDGGFPSAGAQLPWADTPCRLVLDGHAPALPPTSATSALIATRL